MARKLGEKKISAVMARDIIEVLKTRHHMTLSNIAELTGRTERFLPKIEKGEAGFTIENISKIEKAGIPIFVHVGEHLLDKLTIKYRNKGQEVPIETLQLYGSFMNILIVGAKLREAAENK